MTASAHSSGVETCGSSRRRNASAVASAARAAADAASAAAYADGAADTSRMDASAAAAS